MHYSVNWTTLTYTYSLDIRHARIPV